MSPTSPEAILVADDHAAIRMGVRAMLLDMWPSVRVVEVSDGISFQRELTSRRWDLVVVDQTMPGEHGLDVIEKVVLQAPVLIYTMHESPEIVHRARDSGASGFVCKSSEPGVLEEAIRTVLRGDFWFPRTDLSGLALLSLREREVMDGLLKGMGPKELGKQLDISASSVQTHTGRLLAKLGLGSTRELFRWAATRGSL